MNALALNPSFKTQYQSPLGTITLVCDSQALTYLWFNDQWKSLPSDVPSENAFPASGSSAATEAQDHPILEEAKRWLDLYFSGQNPTFLPPLKYDSTPFRTRVYQILLTIPYGQTMTYGEIARQLAKERGLERMSAQAVGGAVGHNPIALMIPCHRVVGTNGKLTGYAAGLDRKAKLLNLEAHYGHKANY